MVLTIEGRPVNAPGFTLQTFVAAVERAKADGLKVSPIKTNPKGRTAIINPSNGNIYLTSRTTCTCKAGERGIPCKHIAAAIYAFDVKGRDITKPGLPERTDARWKNIRDCERAIEEVYGESRQTA